MVLYTFNTKCVYSKVKLRGNIFRSRRCGFTINYSYAYAGCLKKNISVAISRKLFSEFRLFWKLLTKQIVLKCHICSPLLVLPTFSDFQMATYVEKYVLNGWSVLHYVVKIMFGVEIVDFRQAVHEIIFHF